MASFRPKKIFSNILILVSSSVVARLVAFAATAHLTRVLGPDGFGIIGFAFAFCSYFFLPINVSMNNIGAKEIARQPEKFEEYVVSIVFTKLCLAIIAISIVTLIIVQINKPDIVKWVVFLSCFSFFTLAFDCSWVFKGLERNAVVGISLVLGQAIYAGGIIMMIKDIEDIKLVPLWLVLGEMVAAWLLVRVLLSGKTSITLKHGLTLLRNSLSLISTRFLRTLIITADVLLIGFMLTDKDVGLYVAAYRICFFLMAILQSISVSYIPALTRTHTQNENKSEKLTEIVHHAQHITAIICVPLVVGGCLFAESIMSVLFGDVYSEAGLALQLLIISIGFGFFSSIIHNVFLVFDRLKIEMWIVGFAAIVNIILNIFLIPEYGIAGAAFSTTITNGLILLLGLGFIARLKIKFKWTLLLKPFFAAAVMGVGLVYYVDTVNLIINIILGAVFYCSVFMMFWGISYFCKFTIKSAK